MRYIFIICPFFSLIVCQLFKVLYFIINKKQFNLKLLTTSGGMPSSHSSFVASLVTIIGLIEGINSSIFATSLIFGLIICYDASHVRYESGRHAKVLNERFNLDMNELLGHKLLEVIVGSILGILISSLIYFCII